MAGSAEPSENQSSDVVLPHPLDPTNNHHPNSPQRPQDFTVLQKHVAKLYGQGIPRAKIARALVDQLSPANRERPLEQRLSSARRKLRNWEQSQKFRDMVWELAVVDLDMSTPGILRGLSAKARRGRVDAAKLALEITGRHAPRGDGTMPNIIVAINGIPRPGLSTPAISNPDTVEADDFEEV